MADPELDETASVIDMTPTSLAKMRSVSGRIRAGDTLGRYTVRDLLGRGGMGEVFEAYDPELDRVVALKVLRPDLLETSATARARFVREAQAMGRLNHPNVVSIYDVGTAGERVFVAMELVAGPDLKAWLAEHPDAPPRELVEIFLQAGRGLAAAHDAGIVHRDFKSSNVILGDRVRVADFGLARLIHQPSLSDSVDARGPTSPLDTEVTEAGTLIGTRAFMAPEQREGALPSPLSDQYSFGVAMHDALFGVHPDTPRPAGRRVPSWISRIVDRAMRPRPEERYPSMHALLAELGRDPARNRRRALWAAGTLLIVGASLAIALQARRPPCEGADAQVAAIWDDPRQAQVAAAFRTTGLPYATDTFTKVDRGLRQWQAAWARGHRDACEATEVRHEQSEALLDRRMQCLAKAKAEVAALVSLLAHADRTAVDRAAQASLEVGAPDVCADPAALSTAAPPPDPRVRAEVDDLRAGLAQLAALRKLGHWKDGVALGHDLIERARRVAYPPVLAQILAAEASLELTADGDIDASIQRLYEATRIGSLTAEDAAVASAFNNLVYAFGSKKRAFEAAEVAYQAALAAVARIGNPPRSVAELHLYRSYTLYRKGDFAGALEQGRAALALQTEIYGPRSIQAAIALGNVAGSMKRMGHAADAQPLLDRAVVIAEEALGPMHPNYGTLLENSGGNLRELGEAARAADLLERAVKNAEDRGEPDNPSLAHRLDVLATARFEQRRLAEARRLLERAIAIHIAKQGENATELSTSYSTLAEVSRLQGDPAQAHRLQLQAMAIDRKTFGDKHATVGDGYRYDARALTALGQLTEAHAAIERALAIDKQTIGDDHPEHGDTLQFQGELLCAERHCAAAVGLFRQALAIHEKEVGPNSPVLAESLVGLCEALLASGDAGAARAAGDRVVGIGTRVPPDLLGAAQFCVARCEWLTGDRDVARQHARAAREILGALEFPARELPELDRWLADHR
ncbi:MAG TPA: serine/threonine-protein kinase [Kofleriaceae bacterium]|nr:serine/threonine-protein kinase [Kofleriaceae bacterium]